MSTDMDDAEIITQVTQKLNDKFPNLPPADIEQVVRDEFEPLSQGSVRDYLGVLTERAAKSRLKRELASA